MKFSESWLREWVNPTISRAELVEQITMAGLEVDEVSPAAAEFSGVVVGHVVECGPHPDAEKLQVTKIDIGADELLDIVCGAKNCRQGLKVAVATVGAVLPGNFKIKKAKLRGVPSFGMLCSEAELGMLDEAPGIMELPADAQVGTDVRELLQLDDVCIEVDLTPNRADCLSIAGLAREVGVLNNLDVAPVQFTAVTPLHEQTPEVQLEATDACAQYVGRIIKGIDITAKSPLWLVEKLRRSGIRSIDAVVDVTNYVMLEMGQPLHAFDLNKVEQKIRVRYAQENEKLTLLDGQEISLSTDTLVIADANKALALAGIFGGKDSGVSSQSQDILLESAFFSPDYMKGKARQYGLHTDSSHRFERGVDAGIQQVAIERASQLIIDICGGQAGPINLQQDSQKLPQAKTLTLRKNKLDARIGVKFNNSQVEEILSRLGLSPVANDEGWSVTVPGYRFDIAIEVDLIEEIARIYGYNNIPNVAPVGQLKMSASSEKKVSLTSVKHQLAALGYQEAITYSFVDPKAQKALHPDIDALVLPHPISADMSAMRVSHLTGLLNSVIYNTNRQQSRVRLFESGLKFVPDQQAENGIKQVNVLSGAITGLKFGEHWALEKHPVDFYDLKGDIQQILEKIDLKSTYEFKIQSHTALHPGQSAAIYKNGHYLGFLGAVHPQAAKDIGLKSKVFVFELDVELLLNKTMIAAQPVSKFPSNRRDLAFIVDKQTELGAILSEIENLGANQLVELNLFDVYQGDGIQDDKKSFAVSLVIQDVDKTLEEKDISAITDKIIAQLESKFSATLRD